MTTDRLAKVGILIAVLTLLAIIPSTFDWLSRGTPPFLTFFFGSRPFLDWVLHLAGLAVLFGITIGMVVIMAKVALTAERRSTGWVRSITNPNAKFLFGFLIVGWCVVMFFLSAAGLSYLQSGGIALLMLFVGFFLFMGFIWAVIGE
jgi:hypothetical protein